MTKDMTSSVTDSERIKITEMDDMPLTTVTAVTTVDEENPDSNAEKDATDRLVSTVVDPVSGELTIPEEFNIYRNKKTLTQGLMDIALFSANANQLRYVFERGARSGRAFFYIISSLIIISLVLQIGVAILLLLSTKYTVCEKRQRLIAYRYGNYVTVGIFLITVVNVFIAAFGGSAMAGVTIAT